MPLPTTFGTGTLLGVASITIATIRANSSSPPSANHGQRLRSRLGAGASGGGLTGPATWYGSTGGSTPVASAATGAAGAGSRGREAAADAAAASAAAIADCDGIRDAAAS